mmetsp:Transcript_52474/g.96029  ORF Transcript_52474/g.96029 Transcript_52474/m.96029 type:complete len:699 (+) Transcript_52474:87-2183(+)
MALAFALLLACSGSVVAMELNILHLNDHHSHIEGDDFKYDVTGMTGMSKEGNVKVQYGGYTRLVTLFKETAAAATNVLKLHAGDAMTGTAYYNVFKGASDADMMGHVCFDAFVPGNHEFDDGDANLASFIDKLHSYDSTCPDTPVLGTNIVPGPSSPLKGKLVDHSIKTIGGEKIGLIGIDVRGKTMASSSPDPGTYLTDEMTAAQLAIKTLQEDEGVNKIVMLTHVGYEMDKTLAASLPGIDVIIGGDSHSLLGADSEAGLVGNVQGPYPTMLKNADGDHVCIVQAWEYAHLMGHLKVEFDAAGKVSSCAGFPKFPIDGSPTSFNPELTTDEASALVQALESKNVFVAVAEDEDTKMVVNVYKETIEELKKQVMGAATEDLCLERFPGQGKSALCDVSATWLMGSDISNIVAKAFMETTKTAHMGIQNGGGVRTDLKTGDLTMNDLYSLLPFSNTIVTLQMDGQQVKNVLEDAYSNTLDLGGSSGSYPYAAGLRWKVDASRNKYSRVYDIEVNPRLEGEWKPIDMTGETQYIVATNDYIAGGKDGYLTFGLIPDELKVDTQTNYVRPMVDYVQKHEKIGKLPKEEYSTQSYINKDGCPHYGYAAGECPAELAPPTCTDVKALYKSNGCCGNPNKKLDKITGPFTHLPMPRRASEISNDSRDAELERYKAENARLRKEAAGYKTVIDSLHQKLKSLNV